MTYRVAAVLRKQPSLSSIAAGVTLSARAIRAPEFALACSRTIEAMPLQERGAPLALNFRSILPADPVAQTEIKDTGALSEQLVTIGAASLAVLVVAAIAVLMGMA